MATEALVTVGPDGRISGATSSDAETLSDLAGGTYRCVLTVPRGRSLDALGFWWAMCSMIADNHPADLTKDNVSDTLKIECGHAHVWQDAAGNYRRSPKSIAFNKLDGASFSRLLDRALGKACDLFGPDLTAAVAAELVSMGRAEPERVAA